MNNMSMKYQEISCPRCGFTRPIEDRQEQVFCPKISCGIYFNRYGVIEEFDKIKSSTTPFGDALVDLAKDAICVRMTKPSARTHDSKKSKPPKSYLRNV